MKTMKGEAAISLNKFKARHLKGQAAMEYLMTYGWMLLVVVIVIAALFFLTQDMFKIEGCNFKPIGFSCGDTNPQIYVDSSNNVWMSIRVFNQQYGQTVKLHKVSCTTATAAEVTTAMRLDPTGTTGAAISEIGTGTSQVLKTKCFDNAGSVLKLTQGSQFKGNYIIWYNTNNDPDPTVWRQAVASVAGPVLQQ